MSLNKKGIDPEQSISFIYSDIDDEEIHSKLYFILKNNFIFTYLKF